MLREIDIPPLWLVLALVASRGLSLVWAGPSLGWFALTVIALGAGLMGAAVLTMVLARTTFVPRRDPEALVTYGPFRISRNPIYLADALILLGAILYWGAWLALPLVPLFMVWITRRYILDEESRLRRAFGAGFDGWAAQVPRWFWRF